jgi:hypothetical protein
MLVLRNDAQPQQGRLALLVLGLDLAPCTYPPCPKLMANITGNLAGLRLKRIIQVTNSIYCHNIDNRNLYPLKFTRWFGDRYIILEIFKTQPVFAEILGSSKTCLMIDSTRPPSPKADVTGKKTRDQCNP